ncbi:YggS family pyridoxal phosphate-dependent enzyme [Pseudoramibacter alactolyticus]|jgi:pyridoxal phosphate enzyme (YggS family)|uniref:YggS family pyridoxal phosphate-dependent enzyme n=1 Tax=Pseudoramibacter alactolyticus TaxID=113287 RepID=UPI0023570D04|nr:YggS family pyridoxal phosphate-dependent enzyme [Pseudoramibacter alactolyticus]MBM6968154.1 YggS family pyridoxal phosphate-dependent enzyme [Pseudoramibacter alactolyticus]
MRVASEATDPEFREIIARNVAKVQSQLPDSVRLIAVTKKHTIAETQAVVDAGVMDLGENHVQDLIKKKLEIKGDIHWHFIGHLQTNKVKYLIGEVAMIHSVSSLKLLKKIEQESAKKNLVTNILLQFNLAEEATKSGFSANELTKATEEAARLSHINLRGLMCMGPMTENSDEIHKIFGQLKEMYDKIKITYQNGENQIDCLSMGMTNDYPIAIAEGATCVRVGRKIFQCEE